MAHKILIGPSSFGIVDKSPLRLLETAGVEVVPNPFGRKLTKEETVAQLRQGVTGLIAGLETLDREVMVQSKLRVISRVGTGMSNVDINAARELGIEVRSTPDAPTAAVAELTLGALIALLREIPRMSSALHEDRWEKVIGAQLEGRRVLIVGFGRIGQRVATLAQAFGATISVFDPFLSGVPAPYVKADDLHAAVATADVVSLHAAGEMCLIDEAALQVAKPGVYILNAARGGLVDEAALVEAIRAGKVAGAWMDTFEREPYTGPLQGLRNVILTPHVGSYTAECRSRMETEAVQNLLSVLFPTRPQ